MNTETKTLSDDLLNKIKEALQKKPDPKYYWDYNDSISIEQIVKAKDAFEKKKVEKALWYIQDEIAENNIDHEYDIEIEHIKDVLEDFEDDIQTELDDEDVDLKELAIKLRDDLLDYVSVDMNIKGLLKKTSDIPLRIEMLSNYDCINSHWFESQSPYKMDSYFGDVVRILQFNPAEIKKMLLKKGLLVAGKWPNKPNLQPLIKIEDLWIEMENRSSPACLLTILATADPHDFLENFHKDATITIPKGNNVGFFSSWQGGGSMLEAELQRDLVIDLTKTWDKGYGSWRVEIDENSSYSVKEVFGSDSSIYGNNITIQE